jgi:hypothetical protein
MLTPEFLAASIIALGIGARREGTVRPRETDRAARETGDAAVRSRRGRRLRKRGFPPESRDRR